MHRNLGAASGGGGFFYEPVPDEYPEKCSLENLNAGGALLENRWYVI